MEVSEQISVCLNSECRLLSALPWRSTDLVTENVNGTFFSICPLSSTNISGGWFLPSTVLGVGISVVSTQHLTLVLLGLSAPEAICYSEAVLITSVLGQHGDMASS